MHKVVSVAAEMIIFARYKFGKSTVTHYCVNTINCGKMQVPHEDMITTVLFFKEDLAKSEVVVKGSTENNNENYNRSR